MLTNITLIILNLWLGLSASVRGAVVGVVWPLLSRPHCESASAECGRTAGSGRDARGFFFCFNFSVVTNLPKL